MLRVEAGFRLLFCTIPFCRFTPPVGFLRFPPRECALAERGVRDGAGIGIIERPVVGLDSEQNARQMSGKRVASQLPSLTSVHDTAKIIYHLDDITPPRARAICL